jgi:hypothetical protein
MKRWPKIRRLVKVEFSPQEFMSCINSVEAKMRLARSHDPHVRTEYVGEFFGDLEKGMAFSARMQCMMELHSSQRIGAFTQHDSNGPTVSRVGLFHAAALAPLHYDDDHQFFDEKEFFDIAELEQKALIAATKKE